MQLRDECLQRQHLLSTVPTAVLQAPPQPQAGAARRTCPGLAVSSVIVSDRSMLEKESSSALYSLAILSRKGDTMSVVSDREMELYGA